MKTYKFPEVQPSLLTETWYLRAVKENDVPKWVNINELPKEFVRGYKKMKCLEMIKANNGARYVDIIKVLYELSHGEGTYSSTHNRSRGYSVGLFSSPYQKSWPQLCCDHIGKLYVINERGEKELIKLQEKFN